jgi:hypothetical protein
METYTSDTGMMLLEFTSDESVTGEGFSAEWSSDGSSGGAADVSCIPL